MSNTTLPKVNDDFGANKLNFFIIKPTKKKEKEDTEEDKIKNNYKNFRLLTEKSNYSNSLKRILNPYDKYFKRIEFLDPLNYNEEMLKIRDDYEKKKISHQISSKHLQSSENRHHSLSKSYLVKAFFKNMNSKNSYMINKFGHLVPYEKINTETSNLKKYSSISINKNSSEIGDENLKNYLPDIDDEKNSINKKQTEQERLKVLDNIKFQNSDYLKRMENLAKEKKFEQRSQALKENNNIMTVGIDKNYILVRSIDSEIFNKNAEISVLKQKIRAINIAHEQFLEAKKLFGLEGKNSIAIVHKLEIDDMVKQEIQKKNEKCQEIENLISDLENETVQFKIEKKEVRDAIEELQRKVKENNIELHEINKKLVLHYHELLIQGKDTREDGLSWLIIAIWNLDEEVVLSYLPEFLDELSVKYIFENSQRVMELRKLKEDEEIIRENIAEQRILIKQNEHFSSTGNTFETELNLEVYNEMEKLKLNKLEQNGFKPMVEKGVKHKEKVYVYPVDRIDKISTMKEIEKNIISKHKLDTLTKDLMVQVKSIEVKK